MASRDIAPLEIILAEEPLVFCPDDITDSCLVCGGGGEGAGQCEGCGHTLCPECREEHGGECRILAQCRQLDLSLDQDSLLLIRMLERRKSGGSDWNHIGW